MSHFTTLVRVGTMALLLIDPIAPADSPSVSARQRLGIDLSDPGEIGRTRVLRLNVSGGRGSRTLLLMDVPAAGKETKVSVSSRDKRVSVQPVTRDGVWTALSRFELDGLVAPGQGTGVYVEALQVGEPGRPADVVTVKTELGTIVHEVWIAPLEGQWRPAGQDGQSLSTQIWAVHAALVRQGDRARVLFFSPPGVHADNSWNAAELNNMDTAMWDLSTNRVTTGHFTQNLFCSGHALLPDGRLFIAGGHIGGFTENNARGAVVFDGFHPASPDGISDRNFQVQPVQMRNARWYPTVTLMPDGKMLVSSGRGFPLTNSVADATWYRTIARDYEMFLPGGAAGSEVGLFGRFIGNGLEPRNMDFATYPTVVVLPAGPGYEDGAVFMQEQRLGRLYAYRPRAQAALVQAGAAQEPVTWTMRHQGSRSYPYYGSGVLLPLEWASPRRVRILMTGGQGQRYVHNPLDLNDNQPATETAEVFDFDPGRPLTNQRGWRTVPPLAHARFLHDATLLANGEVLISGGASRGWTNVDQFNVPSLARFVRLATN
jgi:hypothetical protein